ncbi:MAG TPA: hypothetical protein DCY72_00915 [Ruminococcaceae bacterium]|nr:hypothetical protein [Oscillospiraceae bacterium]
MGEKITLSLTILLTGFAVVFAVLLALIGIIKAYGTAVYKVQNRHQMKKITRNADLPKAEREPEDDLPVAQESEEEDNDELIAVISAAVYSMYSPKNIRIKSIRKAPSRTNAWRNAGISDNVRPF